MAAVPPEQIYAEEMYFLGKGYALWQADPLGAYPSVCVGDAGYLNYGKFYPGWNLYKDNDLNVPIPRLLEARINANFPFHSKTIKQHSVSAGLENDGLPLTTAGAGAIVSYNCSSSRGAILTLVDKYAMSYDLSKSREDDFLKHILCNIDKVAKSCDCSVQDLVAITGCTLTGDWEAAVVHSSSRGAGLDASGGAPTIIALKAEVSLQHSHEQNIQMSGGHYHNPPREEWGCCDRPKNQCIFVRSFRFKKRFLSSKYKPFNMKAAAEPREDKKDPESGCGDGGLKVPAGLPGYESDEAPCIRPERFPPQQNTEGSADELFNWIFQNNKTAEVAVVHDRDIMRWKDEYFKQVPYESWKVQEGDFSGHKVAYVKQAQAKALIISLRYFGQTVHGSDFEIHKEGDPHADAIRLKDILIERYHYTASDVTLVLESSSPPEMTTKAGLLREIEALVEGINDNDRVLFFFSGHASQQYGNVGEPLGDGFTETIWPTDHQDGRNVLYEHDIHEALVAPLQHIACKMTAIFDTCSSETILDLSGTIDFTQTDDIKIIEESTGPSELHRQFSDFDAGQGEGPSSVPMTGGGGLTFPEGTSPRFQVIRGKLGLRENYICTSFSDFATVDEVDFNTRKVGHHPAVVQFSRRAAIRSYLLDSADGEGDEAREMAPYHEDYSNLSADSARTQVERTINQVLDVLPETSEQDPDRFTFEFLERALRSSLAIPMTRRTQKLIDLTKCVTMLAELLCDRPNLLQASNWDTHSTTMHGLLVFIMDLERFYNECGQVLADIDQLDSDEQKERYKAITNRATEHKQTLINLRKDFLPLEGGTREINPQTLIEGDTTYKPEYIMAEEIPRATVVSWTNAVPSDMYDIVRGRNGMVKAFLDILDENPHPRYWDMLNNLPSHLQTYEERDFKKRPVMSDRVQLSSIKTLDLIEQLTL